VRCRWFVGLGCCLIGFSFQPRFPFPEEVRPTPAGLAIPLRIPFLHGRRHCFALQQTPYPSPQNARPVPALPISTLSLSSPQLSRVRARLLAGPRCHRLHAERDGECCWKRRRIRRGERMCWPRVLGIRRGSLLELVLRWNGFACHQKLS
jgi:hypothetical protein